MTEKVYLDANILFSFALGQVDRGFARSDKIIERAKSGEFKLFISNFTLSETNHAIKNTILREITKSSPLTTGYSSDNSLIPNIEAEFRKKHSQAYMKIVSMITSNPKQVEMESQFTEYPPDLFYSAAQFHMKIQGKIKLYSIQCPICQTQTLASFSNCSHVKQFVYKGVNIQDILHVDLAKLKECTRLITADQGFEELRIRAVPLYIEIV
jgi:predicted nucleic acid-binding protein